MKENNLGKNTRYDSFEQMLQSCKEEYCRQKYDAESVEKTIIDNIILKRKKSRAKKLISIVATIALVLASSIVISTSYLSDTGYADYQVKKIVYFVSPDKKLERLPEEKIISGWHFEDKASLLRLAKEADIYYEFGYLPADYNFMHCNVSDAVDVQKIEYIYGNGERYLYISTQKYDNSGSVILNGKYVKTLDNGAQLVCAKLDEKKYSASLIDTDGNTYIVIGNCGRDEVIKVAENIIIR